MKITAQYNNNSWMSYKVIEIVRLYVNNPNNLDGGCLK